MGKRGRKSSAELTAPTPLKVVAKEVPEPPKCLGDEEAAIWRRVVASMRTGWWRPEYEDLLAQYCRHAVLAERWWRLADGQWQGQRLDVDTAMRVHRAHQLETAQMLSVARALRIPAQSQARPAKTEEPAARKKPLWEG